MIDDWDPLSVCVCVGHQPHTFSKPNQQKHNNPCDVKVTDKNLFIISTYHIVHPTVHFWGLLLMTILVPINNDAFFYSRTHSTNDVYELRNILSLNSHWSKISIELLPKNIDHGPNTKTEATAHWFGLAWRWFILNNALLKTVKLSRLCSTVSFFFFFCLEGFSINILTIARVALVRFLRRLMCPMCTRSLYFKNIK